MEKFILVVDRDGDSKYAYSFWSTFKFIDGTSAQDSRLCEGDDLDLFMCKVRACLLDDATGKEQEMTNVDFGAALKRGLAACEQKRSDKEMILAVLQEMSASINRMLNETLIVHPNVTARIRDGRLCFDVGTVNVPGLHPMTEMPQASVAVCKIRMTNGGFPAFLEVYGLLFTCVDWTEFATACSSMLEHPLVAQEVRSLW